MSMVPRSIATSPVAADACVVARVAAQPHLRLRPRPSAGRSAVASALCLVMALAAAACDASAQKPAGGSGGAGGAGGPAPLQMNAAPGQGLAVLSSDFAAHSTSVALYVPATGEVHDDCVHSSAIGSLLNPSLSGDSILPTQPLHGGELAVIDRENASITLLNAKTCTPRLQFSVSTGGFKSNPHDVISLSADKLYVTRYEKNLDATAATTDFDDGDDILVVDARTGTVTKSILLSAQVPAGVDPSIQARPDRGVLAEGKVYVTLGGINSTFSDTAPGRVVVIDPATDEVTGAIDLPAQKGCSAIEYQPAVKKLYVSCGGAFSDGRAQQVAASALVEIDIAAAPPVVSRTVTAASVGGQIINFSSAAVLGDLAFVGTLGWFPDALTGTPGTSDVLYSSALAGGIAPMKLVEGSASGNFGRIAIDPAAKRVFLPDGDRTAPRVHVFDASVEPATRISSFEPNPAAHLPPREVAWY